MHQCQSIDGKAWHDERPHGFRSSLRTWLAECTNASEEVAETVLAHKVGSQSRSGLPPNRSFADIGFGARNINGTLGATCVAGASRKCDRFLPMGKERVHKLFAEYFNNEPLIHVWELDQNLSLEAERLVTKCLQKLTRFHY